MWEKIKSIWVRMNRWQRIIIIFMLLHFKALPGGQVGFRCNDPALSHAFGGDTISWPVLFSTTVLVPLIVMLYVERKYHIDVNTNNWPKQQALIWYKEYLYGLLLNLIVIRLLKILIGSPRPHFFDTCMPEEALTCQGNEYVSSYTCTKAHWLTESNKSFPSGHTSLGFHAALFLAYYLERRIGGGGGFGGVRSAQALIACAGVCCAVSRVWDRRHHWWDVLGGTAIAAPILSYTVQSLCKNFECSTPKKQLDDKSQENGTDSENLVTNNSTT